MDQQQFKVRMSISTKLLLVIFFLAAAPTVFLSISAITMFRRDKVSHVRSSQATQVVLVGREFVALLNNSIEFLRHVTLDSPLEKEAFVAGIEIYDVGSNSGLPEMVGKKFLPSIANPPTIDLNKELDHYKNEFADRGHFLKNITTDSKSPFLALCVREGTRILVGYLDLNPILAIYPEDPNHIVMLSSSGELLLHSDTRTLVITDGKPKSWNSDKAFITAAHGESNLGTMDYIAEDGTRRFSSFYRPGLDIISLVQTEYELAMASTNTFIKRFLLLEIVSFVLTLALGWYFSKRIMAPLQRLFMATTQLSEGKFNINIPVVSHDEIGALANSFSSMSKKISDLMQEQLEKLRVGTELEIAKTVQQSLFPPKRLKNEHLSLYSEFQSARECGGDWLGYFRSRNKYVVIVADATGHGLPSALMTAAARACFSLVEKLMSDPKTEMPPAEMLKLANRVVFDSAQGRIMMTCYACVLDIDARTITYSSAGHNPAWLFRKADDGTIKLTSLITSGVRLGETQEILTPFEQYTVPMQTGDTLVLYTDGILDAKNADGEPFGKRRLRKAIEAAINEDPKTIITDLILEFYTHTLNKPLDDDVTISVLRVLS